MEFEGYITYEYIVIRTLEKLFDAKANFHKILEFTMLALNGKRNLETAYNTATYFVNFDSMSNQAIKDVIEFEKSLGTD